MNPPEALVESSGAPATGAGGEFLRIRGVTAGYRGRPAIEDISMTVGAGEAVGVIGHNGAGKTTLLNTVFGAIRPTTGDVTAEGVSLVGTRRANIRTGLAMVPADQFVFASLSVRDNLAIARRNAATAQVAADAEALGRELFPAVWERLDNLAGSMSGGERRMLSIAMALMWQPRLLLLDEPTVGLAPALAEKVFDSLRRLMEERHLSILCVEQSLHHLLRLVDRVYIMRNGRVVGEETADSLRERADYWDLF